MRRSSKWTRPPATERPAATAAIAAWLRRVAAGGRPSAVLAIELATVIVLVVPSLGGRGLHPPPAAPRPARPAPRAEATPPAPSVEPPTAHVLFVGASITTGAEQSSIDTTFPGLVVAGLRDRGLQVDWTERAKWGAYVPEALTWPYPGGQQVIVVHLITNDFVRGTPITTYEDELHQLLVDLRVRSPQADLLCLGTWEKPGALNRDRVSEATYDSAAEKTCAQEDGHFVPLAPIFAAPGSRGPLGRPTPFGPSDDFHPNDLGAQRIAAAVLRAIPVTPTTYPRTPGRI